MTLTSETKMIIMIMGMMITMTMKTMIMIMVIMNHDHYGEHDDCGDDRDDDMMINLI